MTDDILTGRCYCGACSFSAKAAPLAVAYCHCSDCRRWTGAPVAAFAAFAPDALEMEPNIAEIEHVPDVARRACPTCGSPLTARFGYLPGQVYVPLGIFDDASELVPSVHCHDDARLPWLHIADDLPRMGASARDRLNEAAGG